MYQAGGRVGPTVGKKSHRERASKPPCIARVNVCRRRETEKEWRIAQEQESESYVQYIAQAHSLEDTLETGSYKYSSSIGFLTINTLNYSS
jgi:hypothetical protein